MFMIEGTAVHTGTAVGRRLQKGAPAYPAYCCWKRLAREFFYFGFSFLQNKNVFSTDIHLIELSSHARQAAVRLVSAVFVTFRAY